MKKLLQESATGDGPVDAIFNSIDRALNTKYKVESYQVRSVTSGRQAMGEALIRIRNERKKFIPVEGFQLILLKQVLRHIYMQLI